MSGLAITVSAADVERLSVRISRLAGLDTRRLLDAVGAEVESQVRRRIDVEKEAPDGSPWAAWSRRYAGTRDGRHSLLVGQGDLHDSIQHEVREDEVEVGSNLVYAAIHQFGGEDVGKGIPARPYLGLSPDNEDDVRAVVEDWLARSLEDI